MASKLYATLSWALIVLGVVHVASSFRIYSEIAMPALWFIAGGILIILGATLNLLNRSYGAHASGLRAVTVGANVAIGAIATAGGLLSRASVGQLVVVLGTYLAVTALSVSRSAQLRTPGPVSNRERR